MRRTLVWDLPLRIFHWLFAAGFVAAFAIARVSDEDSALFAYHALIGTFIAGLVSFRIIWLFLGTKWSRLTGLALHPAELVRYMVGVFAARSSGHIGHNPATSWTLLTMLAGVAGLTWTGFAMGRGSGAAENLHSLLANGLILLAILHVSGVLLHSLLHCDGLPLSMIHGEKQLGSEPSVPPRSGVAVAFFLVLCAVVWPIASTYDPFTASFRLPGIRQRLSLTTSEQATEWNPKEEDAEDHD